MPSTKKVVKKVAKTTAKPAVVSVAKKSVAQGAVKKTPTKKTITKKSTQAEPKVTGCACVSTCAPEQAFWVNQGPVVDSIARLKDALQSMTEEQFAYHTLREGNDFARWVRECLDDAERAARLERATTKAAAVKALNGVCCK